jgi:hypothetical protein
LTLVLLTLARLISLTAFLSLLSRALTTRLLTGAILTALTALLAALVTVVLSLLPGTLVFVTWLALLLHTILILIFAVRRH